ncbi:NADH oxidase [Mrakia frigida]|uniref:NADH:flavin oxidoreductase/NADH oxidase family protein n=1 Tax=Mrakia frigida TaxID=29902 RepID=UPI003FCC0F24
MPSQVSPTILASPLKFPISGKVAPNRFLKSAMTERLCTYDQDNHDLRGKPTPEYIELYEQWGKGAIGIIVLGNLPVDRTALEAKKNAIIDKRSSWDPVEAFKPVIAASKRHGSLVIGQLTHGGRQTPSDINPHPVSSSDIQNPDGMGMTFAKPRPMTLAEIDDLVDSFAFAAEVLYKAGADGAQLHAAHGYLLSQFLSGRVNKRTDNYGGSLENRSRIVFRIFEEIKRRVPANDFLLSIKMNSADFAEGGFTDEESAKIAIMLEAAGVELIELSGGTYESGAFSHKKDSTIKREAFFIEFADRIRPTLKTAKLAVTGGFRSVGPMEEALAEKSCDFIGLARPLTADPFFCKDIISGAQLHAAENKVNPSMQTATSVYQIKTIATGKPIPDLSIQEVADSTLQAALSG